MAADSNSGSKVFSSNSSNSSNISRGDEDEYTKITRVATRAMANKGEIKTAIITIIIITIMEVPREGIRGITEGTMTVKIMGDRRIKMGDNNNNSNRQPIATIESRR